MHPATPAITAALMGATNTCFPEGWVVVASVGIRSDQTEYVLNTPTSPCQRRDRFRFRELRSMA